MNVLIVNNMAPFVWGGAEELAVNLQKQLIIAGHAAEILRLPFQWEPATRIPSQMMMVRALELMNVDRVIALKFPAYLIRHPQKTFWLLHQYRQAYDLLDAGQSNLIDDAIGRDIKSLIRSADNESFTEARRIFTNSHVTQKRLQHYNGFASEVLLPPVNDPELFSGGPSEGYIFAGGRINDMKRQHLLLNALKYAGSHVRLVIAGPPDSPADAEKLRTLVKRLGLSKQVVLDLQFLPRATYARYLNESSAVAYLPFDEDSLGYVAMEGATAGKPLITTTDSGGILGLAKHGETGWVTEPDAQALGAVLNAVFANKTRTQQLGEGARECWHALKIDWPNTVEALLQ